MNIINRGIAKASCSRKGPASFQDFLKFADPSRPLSYPSRIDRSTTADSPILEKETIRHAKQDPRTIASRHPPKPSLRSFTFLPRLTFGFVVK